MHIFYDPLYLQHEQDGWHPESPARLRGIEEFLREHGLWENVHAPTDATREDLERVHSPIHIDTIRDFGEGRYDPDTFVHAVTHEIAIRSAGGTIDATRAALEGKRSLALVRPPGHHATWDRAMGFCYYNNVAVAAAAVATAHGKKAAILDVDVHHGNGTNDIFSDDPNVLYLSTHQWGIFPGSGGVNDSGIDDGEGKTVNIPLCEGSGDSTFELAFNRLINPIVREFDPDLFIVSFGGDAHYRDPLASLSLSTSGYLGIARHIFDLADDLCGGGVAFALEGGYDIPSLSESIGGIVGLAGGSDGKIPPVQFTEERDPHEHGRADIMRAMAVQKQYWNIS